MLLYCSKALSRIATKVVQKQVRCISTSAMQSAPASYDGEGKTTVDILNSEMDRGLMVNGISEVGFRLNNDITVLGSMVIFPRSVLSWNVNNINDITAESLSLFTILEPKLEIVVLGVGNRLEDYSLGRKIMLIMKKYRINIEILATEQACTTFNFLNSEGRYVGAALIPPTKLQTSDDDLIRSKLRYQNIYELQD